MEKVKGNLKHMDIIGEVEKNMSDEVLPMLQGKFPELKKMKLKDMQIEIEAWRNIWGYVPSEVKYYLLKSGSQVGITMRNYHRYLGVLLSTRWDITELEVGVFEKFYDQNDGQYYYERKIVKLNPKSVIDIQWINERVNEVDMSKEEEPALEEEPQPEIDTGNNNIG